MFISTGNNQEVAASASELDKASAISLKIVYTPAQGDTTDAAGVLARWTAAITGKNKAINLVASDNSDTYDSTHKPVTNGGGVKFFLDDNPSNDGATAGGGWAGGTETANLNRSIAVSAIDTEVETFVAGTGANGAPVGSWISTTTGDLGSYYLGIKGLDDVAQDTWTYQISVAASFAS